MYEAVRKVWTASIFADFIRTSIQKEYINIRISEGVNDF